MLNILVCVKQVPDVDLMEMDPETGNLVREGVPAILNPLDAHALSAAMELKETYGGEVTAITMGPPAAEAVLRDCLAVGADRAVLVTDRAFANADTLATSYSLAAAAAAVGQFDLILCGRESLDGATGQMGPQLAERFGAAQVTNAGRILELDSRENFLTIERIVEKGVEKLEVRLPVLLTVNKGVYPQRVPGLKGKMRAKKAPILTLTCQDIPGLDPKKIGDPGSPTKVPRTFLPKMPEPGIIIQEGSIQASVQKLCALLRSEGERQ